LQQLDKLELNSAERLEGMINVIFSKAVIEKSFCNQYAKLCKDFQRKQVTVPGEDGQPVTHFFRQKLLTRCQNGFEGDYRQEIDYSKRKAEVDAITDEKNRKEEDEQLAEDLHKAKQRKFGNIL
jgi:translation initiation factor 4G